jgi:non-ribosomal peptide synthetase component F
MGSIPALSILRGEVRPFNGTPLLLHRLLEQTVCLSGQKKAVTFRGKTLSFETLDAAASRLARALLQHVRSTGAQANQDGDFLVAVCMDPSDLLVVTLLAVWKTGAAYLPLDPSFPPARVSHILSEAQPMLIIADKGEFCFRTSIHHCLQMSDKSLSFTCTQLKCSRQGGAVRVISEYRPVRVAAATSC